MDIGLGVKPPGYYVQRSNGLFPAPIPQENKQLNKICKLFELLGLFLAKCIQDGRRVDIPLSDSFLKLMCSQAKYSNTSEGQVSLKRNLSMDSRNDECLEDDNEQQQRGIERLISEDNDSPRQVKQDNKNTLPKPDYRQARLPTTRTSSGGIVTDASGGASAKERLLLVDVDETKAKHDCSKDELARHKGNEQQLWFSCVLDRDDLYTIDPYRRKFLRDLSDLVHKRDEIYNEGNLSVIQKQDRIDSLRLGRDNDRLEDVM